MTEDLISWLTQQLDEDERIAKAASVAPWSGSEPGPPKYQDPIVYDAEDNTVADRASWGDLDADDMRHMVRFDPARVLREVEAKRQILAQHPPGEDGYCGDGLGLDGCKWDWPCPTVRLLTLPYADRPGFKEEWRIEP